MIKRETTRQEQIRKYVYRKRKGKQTDIDNQIDVNREKIVKKRMGEEERKMNRKKEREREGQ